MQSLSARQVSPLSVRSFEQKGRLRPGDPSSSLEPRLRSGPRKAARTAARLSDAGAGLPRRAARTNVKCAGFGEDPRDLSP